MICKICGESGHFTQGCPSTLGANRKSQDFFERVPARDPHVKALFSEKVVNKIEKDIGCKIKVEEKFIIVSGKDRLILKKGIDTVHKIKEEGEHNGIHKFPDEAERKVSSSGSPISWFRSPERRSPATSRLGRTDSQKSHPSPHNSAHNPHKYGRPDKFVEDRVREDLLKLSSGSPQASGNDGGRGRGRGRASRSKSPVRPSFIGNAYNSIDGHGQNRGGYQTDGWNLDKGEADLQLSHNVDHSSFPRTLEELEFQYKREAMDLARLCDKEEDEENYSHREAVREIRENYIKNVAVLKDTHAKMWEEFLHLEGQRRQQQALHRVPVSGFGGYKQPSYQDLDNSTGNLHHAGPSVPTDSRGRYQSATESYTTSRPPDTYVEIQRHRRDDFGKAYNRY